MGKIDFFFSTMPFNPLGSFSHTTACRSSSKNIRKISLILIFNKNSPGAYTESELDVLGGHGKLMKYVVHSSKRKKNEKNEFSSHKLPKQKSTSFWSQGILGVKLFITKHYFVRSTLIYVM
jgi:hypothetical protein